MTYPKLEPPDGIRRDDRIPFPDLLPLSRIPPSPASLGDSPFAPSYVPPAPHVLGGGLVNYSGSPYEPLGAAISRPTSVLQPPLPALITSGPPNSTPSTPGRLTSSSLLSARTRNSIIEHSLEDPVKPSAKQKYEPHITHLNTLQKFFPEHKSSRSSVMTKLSRQKISMCIHNQQQKPHLNYLREDMSTQVSEQNKIIQKQQRQVPTHPPAHYTAKRDFVFEWMKTKSIPSRRRADIHSQPIPQIFSTGSNMLDYPLYTKIDKSTEKTVSQYTSFISSTAYLKSVMSTSTYASLYRTWMLNTMSVELFMAEQYSACLCGVFNTEVFQRQCTLPVPTPNPSLQPIPDNLVLPRSSVANPSDRHQRFPFSDYSRKQPRTPTPDLYPEFVISTFAPTLYPPVSSGNPSSYDYIPPFIHKRDLIHYRPKLQQSGVIPANLPRTLTREENYEMLEDALFDLDERIFCQSHWKHTKNAATIPWMNNNQSYLLKRPCSAIQLPSISSFNRKNAHLYPSLSPLSAFASRHSYSSTRYLFHSSNGLNHTPLFQMLQDRRRSSSWTPDEKERFVLVSLIHPRNYEAIARESLVNKTRSDLRDFAMFDIGLRKRKPQKSKSNTDAAVPPIIFDNSNQIDPLPKEPAQQPSETATTANPPVTHPYMTSRPLQYFNSNPIQRWIRECGVAMGIALIEETEELKENAEIERNIKLKFQQTSQDYIPALPEKDLQHYIVDQAETSSFEGGSSSLVSRILTSLPLNRTRLPPLHFPSLLEPPTPPPDVPRHSNLTPPQSPIPSTPSHQARELKNLLNHNSLVTTNLPEKRQKSVLNESKDNDEKVESIFMSTRQGNLGEKLGVIPQASPVEREKLFLFNVFDPPSAQSLFRNPHYPPNVLSITQVRRQSVKDFLSSSHVRTENQFVLNEQLHNVKRMYPRRVGGHINYSFYGNGIGVVQTVQQHNIPEDQFPIPQQESQEPYGSLKDVWFNRPPPSMRLPNTLSSTSTRM
ncbi:hypothetical protein BLNAU_10334 [Blattamonas nauphoetae]|uniref:Myb-like domain-containing protein n=1 Tax=Blattamonas nauphoetae TaxID=2049346 RepID=A0ABQ9XT75_9EUKA|nr:hypothetical protein BLNAU_10334 [Blattamonas nauphoetae]